MALSFKFLSHSCPPVQPQTLRGNQLIVINPDLKSSNSLLSGLQSIDMFSAYVLKSINHEFYYKGHCHDLNKRLEQHNSGMTQSIRPFIPFKLVYFEEFETEKEAIIREKYFKSAAGRRFLKTKIIS